MAVVLPFTRDSTTVGRRARDQITRAFKSGPGHPSCMNLDRDQGRAVRA